MFVAPHSFRQALVDKGVTLGQQGKAQAAIDIYDKVVNRFGAPQTSTSSGGGCPRKACGLALAP